MDEMFRIIKNLTNNIFIFDMDNGNSNKFPQERGVRNPDQFRSSFNSQLMRKERRNEEQPI
jgi:hypothetical protein